MCASLAPTRRCAPKRPYGTGSARRLSVVSISGILITFCEEREPMLRALEILGQRPELSLGEAQGACIPAVLDTSSKQEDLLCFESIRTTAGVLQVDLVYVHQDPSRDSASDRTRRDC